MSEGLDLGGGEQSPPMPEMPSFLRRGKDGVVEDFANSIGAPPILYAPSEPTTVDPAPPTYRDLIDLLDKLVAKRDKIEASIVEVKKQVIEQVRLL